MAIASYNVATTDENSGFVMLYGWNARETAGSTAVLRIRDGSGGPIVVSIALAANESAGANFPHPIVSSASTWHWDIVSGAVEGALYGGG